MQSTHRRIFIALLLAQAGVRLAMVVGAGPMTDQGFYGDDSYMSHKFAADIAAGRGISQAGEPNNGFQPLFVFLLVPFYWFLNIYQATVASALLNSAFSVAGSAMVFLLLRNLFNPRVGLIGMGLWALSPHLTRVGLNGLETSLANLLMLLVVFLHLRSRRLDRPFSAARGIVLGVTMGLSMLARLDLGLLLLPLGIDQIRVRLNRRQFSALAATMMAGAVTILPWFGWSRAVCGTWIPISGAATRTLSQLYGSPTGPTEDPQYFPLGQVPLDYYTGNLAHAWKQLVTLAPLSMPVMATIGEHVGGATMWLGIVVALAMLVGRRASADDDWPDLAQAINTLGRQLWFVWAFCGLLMGAYCFYYFAQWHFWRYFTPVTIAMIFPSAVCLDQLVRWLSSSRARKTFGAVCLLGAVSASGVAHVPLYREADPTGIAKNIYLDAIELFDHIPSDSRVGSFESGTLDYFLTQDIYNLDGKTNARAHRALVDGRLDQLVEELQLDYVVSSPPLIRDLLDRRGQWPPGKLQMVDRPFRHNLIIKVSRGP